MLGICCGSFGGLRVEEVVFLTVAVKPLLYEAVRLEMSLSIGNNRSDRLNHFVGCKVLKGDENARVESIDAVGWTFNIDEGLNRLTSRHRRRNISELAGFFVGNLAGDAQGGLKRRRI